MFTQGHHYSLAWIATQMEITLDQVRGVKEELQIETSLSLDGVAYITNADYYRLRERVLSA